jgi:hypothetical protein
MLRINDHLYSLDELEPWVARVKSIAQDAEETYVVTNNHNFGKSTVNALQLQAFLSPGPSKCHLDYSRAIPNFSRLRKSQRIDFRTGCNRRV